MTTKLLRWGGGLALMAGLAWAQSANPVNEPTPTSETKNEIADRRIAPNDLLQIVIVGETGLPTDFRVSASGTIDFHFINIVEVKGLTTTELRAKLRAELMKDYFVDPEVHVAVKEYSPQYVKVIGQVLKPGPVALLPEQKMDILDAIAFAGGPTRAAKKTVEFYRNGVRQTFTIEKLEQETDPAKRIWLQPGDLIKIGESIL